MAIWDDGFDHDSGESDRLMDAGWWPSETVRDVQAAIKALVAEPLYEKGDKANGVSTRFLARLTLLQNQAEILGYDDPLVVEARAMFAAPATAIRAEVCEVCGGNGRLYTENPLWSSPRDDGPCPNCSDPE